MRKTIAIAALTAALAIGWSQQAEAQRRHLPSPKAETTQRVATTDVTISYHRPGVKGRVIWGDLVPYGEYWRAGANATTAITFEHDVTIEGQEVPAGTYGFFILPKEDGPWELVLSEETGTNGQYPGEEHDVIRIEDSPEDVPHLERLRYGVDNLVDDAPTATVFLHWEEKRVGFDIKTPAPEGEDS